MSPPEKASSESSPRYGRYVGILGIIILVLITANTLSTKPNGSTGVKVGERLPPFATPLARGHLNGDSDIATRPKEGAAGSRPACQLRGREILNICELYERGPVVLALFVNADPCVKILDQMQALSSSFTHVSFAAVAIKGDRGSLRRLVQTHHLSIAVGYDHDGVLAQLYRLSSCPQVTYSYPGGIVQGAASLGGISSGQLRRRVSELVSATRNRYQKLGAAHGK